MSTNDPDVVLSAGFGFDTSGFDAGLNKIQTAIVDLQISIMAMQDKVDQQNDNYAQAETDREREKIAVLRDLLEQKLELNQQSLAMKMEQEENYTQQQSQNDKAAAEEDAANLKQREANAANFAKAKAIISQQIEADDAAAIKFAADEDFALLKDREAARLSYEKYQAGIANSLAEEEIRALRFASDEDAAILKQREQEVQRYNAAVLADDRTANAAQLVQIRDRLREERYLYQQEDEARRRAAAGSAAPPAGGAGAAAGAAAAGGGGLFGDSQSSIIGFGYGLRSAGMGIPGLRALSALGIAGGVGGGAGLAGAATGVAVAETIRLITELVSLYGELSTKAFELAQNHDYLAQTLAQTSQTVEEHFYPVLQQVQDAETALADWANSHQDVLGGLTDSFANAITNGQDLAKTLLVIVTGASSLPDALDTIAQKVTTLFNKIGDLEAGLKIIASQPGSSIFSDAFALGLSAVPGIGSVAGFFSKGTAAPISYTPPAAPDPTKFLADQQAAINRDPGVQKGQQALAIQQQRLTLENSLLELQSKRDDNEISEVQFLVAQKATKEQILTLDRQSAQLAVTLAQKQLEQSTNDKDRIAATVSLLAAETNLEKIKSSIVQLDITSDNATQRAANAETQKAAATAAKLQKDQEQLGIAEDKLAVAQDETATQAKLAEQQEQLVSLTTQISMMAKDSVGYGDAQVELAKQEYAVKVQIADLQTKVAADQLAKAQATSSGKLAEFVDLLNNPSSSQAALTLADTAYTNALVRQEAAQAKLNDTTIKGNDANLQGLAKIYLAQKNVSNAIAARQVQIDKALAQQRGSNLSDPTGKISAIQQSGTDPNTGEYIDPASTNALIDAQQLQDQATLLELKGKLLDADKADLTVLLAQTTSNKDHAAITNQIVSITQQQRSNLEDILANLLTQQQSVAEGSEDWDKLDTQIQNVIKQIDSLNIVTKTWSQAFLTILDTLGKVGSSLTGIGKQIGSVITDASSALKSISSISNVTDSSGNAAGSLGGGLSTIFSSASGLAQGIPIFGQIASSVIGLASAVTGLFTAAAKAMAAQIDTEVKAIVAATQANGQYTSGIAQLQLQYTTAISELSNKKGGQTQLNSLLPAIASQIQQLQTQLSAIMDSFAKSITDLEYASQDLGSKLQNPLGGTADFQSVFDQVDAAEQKVEQFLAAVGQTPASMAQAAQFMNLTMGNITTQWQTDWNTAFTAFNAGTEDAAGNMVSVATEAGDEITQENTDFAQAETTRQQNLQTLKDNYQKQNVADIQQLADLNNQLAELQTKQVTDLAAIQNQGIASQMQTTQESRAQQEADLINQNKATAQGINTQIANLNAQMALEAQQYNQQLAQAATEEATAQTNHQNTIDRINNEMARSQEAYNQTMANLTAEKQFIDAMNASQAAWIGGTGTPLTNGPINITIVTTTSSTPEQIAAAVTNALNNIAKTAPTSTSLGN